MADPSAHSYPTSTSSSTTANCQNNNNSNNNTISQSPATTTITCASASASTFTTMATLQHPPQQPQPQHPLTLPGSSSGVVNKASPNSNSNISSRRHHKPRHVIYKSTNLERTAPSLVATTSPQTMSASRGIQRANDKAEEVRDNYLSAQQPHDSNDNAAEQNIVGNDDKSNAKKYERRLKMNRKSAAASRVRREAYTKALESELIHMEKDYNKLVALLAKEKQESQKLASLVNDELEALRQSGEHVDDIDHDQQQNNLVNNFVPQQNQAQQQQQQQSFKQFDVHLHHQLQQQQQQQQQLTNLQSQLQLNLHQNNSNNSNDIDINNSQVGDTSEQQLHVQMHHQQHQPVLLEKVEEDVHEIECINQSLIRTPQDDNDDFINARVMLTGVTGVNEVCVNNNNDNERKSLLKDEDFPLLDDALDAINFQLSSSTVKAVGCTTTNTNVMDPPIPDYFLNLDEEPPVNLNGD